MNTQHFNFTVVCLSTLLISAAERGDPKHSDMWNRSLCSVGSSRCACWDSTLVTILEPAILRLACVFLGFIWDRELRTVLLCLDWPVWLIYFTIPSHRMVDFKDGSEGLMKICHADHLGHLLLNLASIYKRIPQQKHTVRAFRSLHVNPRKEYLWH